MPDREARLKPCPFCGGDAELVDSLDGWYCCCRKCAASTVYRKYPKVSVRDWNRMPRDDS